MKTYKLIKTSKYINTLDIFDGEKQYTLTFNLSSQASYKNQVTLIEMLENNGYININ